MIDKSPALFFYFTIPVHFGRLPYLSTKLSTVREVIHGEQAYEFVVEVVFGMLGGLVEAAANLVDDSKAVSMQRSLLPKVFGTLRGARRNRSRYDCKISW